MWENIVEANLLAAEASSAAAGNVYNIGCGARVSLNTLIGLLEENIGVKAEVMYVEPKPGDVRHYVSRYRGSGSHPWIRTKGDVPRGTQAYHRRNFVENSGQASLGEDIKCR
jgi:UDP-glucose 4-epimerase